MKNNLIRISEFLDGKAFMEVPIDLVTKHTGKKADDIAESYTEKGFFYVDPYEFAKIWDDFWGEIKGVK